MFFRAHHMIADGPAAVTLLGVRVTGGGVGTVGRIIRMQAAPIPESDVGTDWVPNGEWVTDPPVEVDAPGSTLCDVQRLAPLNGYVLRPQARVRIAMLLEAETPGVFHFGGVRVRYSQDGDIRSQ